MNLATPPPQPWPPARAAAAAGAGGSAASRPAGTTAALPLRLAAGGAMADVADGQLRDAANRVLRGADPAEPAPRKSPAAAAQECGRGAREPDGAAVRACVQDWLAENSPETRLSGAAPPPFRIAVVGGGLAGCLSSLLLSRLARARPVEVTVLEYREDPRRPQARGARGRSINLALSARGLDALARAGLDGAVRAEGVPMHGRCVHDGGGGTSAQPYGLRGQFLLSVSRARLNELLLDACDRAPNVTVLFGAKCTEVDLGGGRLTYTGAGQPAAAAAGTLEADLIVGADGTYSRVRAAMERAVPRFDSSREHIAAAYKELTISRAAAAEAGMPREYLHVWPRQDFMLIALPNLDGSFTSTLFMDARRLEALQAGGRDSAQAFFEAEFPDAVPLMPDVADQFLASPAPPLLTVRCRPYNDGGRAVVIGDAAHAIVPFYGQGCNAAFEDCAQLVASISQHSLDDMPLALAAYSDERKQHADAIADLAVEHYHDMASKSASPAFAVRRRLEILAHRLMPQAFTPLYSMVTFSTIPYATAVRRARAQDRALTLGAGAALGLSLALGAAAVAAAVTRRRRA
jgi:kynurenine 3-monooxygenase